ncbi:ImmA/IrrE family metallo-endopeptidase [Acetobacter vaccinii]|uniref:ImmA/IrrE family metallo-endopeptidase n=1 Tax=Acetobacter vaccinii TaxID=2592655 RepID=A0A5C1YTU8_9PROT|nr:ImmA/IrrE family metallo-endopeptidase [Acetobacter vaccinii]QEO18799.1 ImmA/IrrE family metallo-endopeptidase [Acetobacter vaccinii]
MTTVAASIPVLRWAAQRARLHDEDLSARFRKWPLWLTGEAQPTLKQLEDFARLTHTAIGYFFLPEPPTLALPVPDFRTLRDEELREPSSALLDTLYLCQQRQDWYRDYARVHGLSRLAFVGSTQVNEAPQAVAERMRVALNLSTQERRQLPTWTDALRQLIAKAEEAGVMVMASGIVGSNSHRRLDVGEFRGFALADDLAPLVFLNGADSKAAQMFTLAHELAHVWLGATGVSDTEAGQVPELHTERWCNQVAAELLMPLQAVRAAYQPGTPVPNEIQRLAREFKVSTLVALRRLFDAGFLDQARLWQHYRDEQARLAQLERRGTGGGDFYRTLGARTSKRFARAIVTSTLEGQTLFQDAFRMLGVRKTATFYEAARELGVMA